MENTTTIGFICDFFYSIIRIKRFKQMKKKKLESFRAPLFHAIDQTDKKGFNLGRKENVKQVFGNSFFKALLPISTR